MTVHTNRAMVSERTVFRYLTLSEAPNGWIKEVLGFRRFSLRGLDKVRGEWDLVCLALNIKRLGALAVCCEKALVGRSSHAEHGKEP